MLNEWISNPDLREISVCQPRWNHTYNMQLGETIVLTEPMPMTITATKQNGRTFTMVMVAEEKKATYVVTFSPEGCTTQEVECPTHLQGTGGENSSVSVPPAVPNIVFIYIYNHYIFI